MNRGGGAVVQAAYLRLDGGLVLLVVRPLGWDVPWFRDPLTGRGDAPGPVVPRRRDHRVQLLPRPGPARVPVRAQAP